MSTSSSLMAADPVFAMQLIQYQENMAKKIMAQINETNAKIAKIKGKLHEIEIFEEALKRQNPFQTSINENIARKENKRSQKIRKSDWDDRRLLRQAKIAELRERSFKLRQSSSMKD